MPRMYNPDTQEAADIQDEAVAAREADGFINVDGQDPEQYVGKSRDELASGKSKS